MREKIEKGVIDIGIDSEVIEKVKKKYKEKLTEEEEEFYEDPQGVIERLEQTYNTFYNYKLVQSQV